jgi:hypothetical protein
MGMETTKSRCVRFAIDIHELDFFIENINLVSRLNILRGFIVVRCQIYGAFGNLTIMEIDQQDLPPWRSRLTRVSREKLLRFQASQPFLESDLAMDVTGDNRCCASEMRIKGHGRKAAEKSRRNS